MKPLGFTPVTVILLIIQMVYSQEIKTDKKDLYIKAGFSISHYSSSVAFSYGTASGVGRGDFFTASIAYDYNPNLQLELQYEHMYGFEVTQDQSTRFRPFDKFYFDASASMKSYLFNLRANYFISTKRWENPVYFIGALILGFQRFSSKEIYTYDTYIKTVFEEKYRFLVGPKAGFGIYWDLGNVDFQTEFSFSTRTIPLKHGEFSESSVNISIIPVLNF